MEATLELAKLETTDQDALAAYRAQTKARLSEMEMALEYWKFMEDAKS